MALGPQNIFLIRQGAMRHHAVLSAIICFFCDVILIIGSVTGLQHILESHPQWRVVMIWFGALFLFYYGFRTLKQSLSKSHPIVTASQQRPSHWQIITLALGFSLLNPHAIIDSLVLIGGGSLQFPGKQHVFLFGVLSSSLIWFTLLTLSAYFFSHLLIREKVWRRIELVSGCVMIYLGVKLLVTQ